ncbi:HAMP domain-containing histidine kinase [Kovacikia minuta CCNUW1]|nr:HAMP domain-containing histidine kinase [Kovacikia minuta CCNUW1]
MNLADLHEGLEETLLLLQHRYKQKINVIKVLGEIPLVECHINQINQVFMNLLSNAIDALEEGIGKGEGERGKGEGELESGITASSAENQSDGDAAHMRGEGFSQNPTPHSPLPTPQIRIQTEHLENDSVRITISDNGPGIPQAAQERLFEPFFTTKPIGVGTGLGLSISHQIVTETHSGQISCHSTPESGTTFVVELPVRQEG